MDQIEKLSLKLSENFKKCENSEEVHHLMQEYLHNAEEKSNNVQLPWPEDNTWINVAPLSQDDILGKVVLLDFFTYCCINCIHIMPFLHKIEEQFSCADGFVVIGVHSAKFPNEKVSKNIINALQRYNISHPVINDYDLKLWNGLSIKCWPTLVLISPQGKVLLSLPGEAHLQVVETLLSESLNYYKDRLSKHDIISLSNTSNFNSPDAEVKFPGKVAMDKAGKRIAIADTANNRIVLCDRNGEVFHVVGSGKLGMQDGPFSTCSFNSPQGVTWHRSNTVFVADCDNHLIRKIDLLVRKVVTVAGTGKQGNDYEGGQFGTEQVLSSPWDVVVAGSPRCSDAESILYIAMSGIHQLWALFLQDADWQKGSEYKMGTCMRMAGSGQEENRNNTYPHKAGFAQPSGLTVDVSSHKLFVADSESSTIRRVNLANGAVEGLVGGHFDPTNLFAFGDADGKARNARLQHPLAVAWDHVRQRLYVADTYNHKIKMVNPSTKISVTMCGPEDCKIEDSSTLNLASIFPAVHLNEPGGLCLDPQCEYLYIADTNNHQIKILNLASGDCDQLHLKFPSNQGITVTDSAPVAKLEYRQLVNPSKAISVQHDEIIAGQNATLELSLRALSIHLTGDAPSSWQISAQLLKETQKSENSVPNNIHLINSGEFRSKDVELTVSLDVKDICKVVLTEKFGEDGLLSNKVAVHLVWEAILYFCRDDSQLCLMRQIRATVPIQIDLVDTTVKVINADISLASLE